MDENCNRRVVLPDNYAVFLPHHAELRNLANGFRDQELGCLFFYSIKSGFPVYVIGNYAAHPLASHGPGTGGRRISADYPAVFRDYITEETGTEAMFVSGACGDMIPKGDEMGSDAMRRMGVHLGEEAFRGMLDVRRNSERYCMKNPKVGAICSTIQAPLRSHIQNNPKRLPVWDLGKTHTELEIQCLAIGEVCFVGIPGEWCAELGAEVKWHSAFRKAFIAFCATSYQDYMCPANFLLQGGYEASAQHFQARYAIAMIKSAVDTMFELKEQLYPLQEDPENFPQTKVNQFTICPTELPLDRTPR